MGGSWILLIKRDQRGTIINTFLKYKLLVQTCEDDMIWVLYRVKTFEYINAGTNSIA